MARSSKGVDGSRRTGTVSGNSSDDESTRPNPNRATSQRLISGHNITRPPTRRATTEADPGEGSSRDAEPIRRNMSSRSLAGGLSGGLANPLTGYRRGSKSTTALPLDEPGPRRLQHLEEDDEWGAIYGQLGIHKPPPDDDASSSTSSTSSSARSTAATSLFEVPHSHNDITTVDKEGFGTRLTNAFGHVVYKEAEAPQDWDAVAMEARQQKLGANHFVYAREAGGTITALNEPLSVSNGLVAPSAQMPEGHKLFNFAVTTGGSVARIEEGPDGNRHLRLLMRKPQTAADLPGPPTPPPPAGEEAPAVPETLPYAVHTPALPEHLGRLWDVSCDSSGRLHVLDENGQLWRASTEKLLATDGTPGTGATAWRRHSDPPGDAHLIEVHIAGDNQMIGLAEMPRDPARPDEQNVGVFVMSEKGKWRPLEDADSNTLEILLGNLIQKETASHGNILLGLCAAAFTGEISDAAVPGAESLKRLAVKALEGTTGGVAKLMTKVLSGDRLRQMGGEAQISSRAQEIAEHIRNSNITALATHPVTGFAAQQAALFGARKVAFAAAYKALSLVGHSAARGVTPMLFYMPTLWKNTKSLRQSADPINLPGMPERERMPKMERWGRWWRGTFGIPTLRGAFNGLVRRELKAGEELRTQPGTRLPPAADDPADDYHLTMRNTLVPALAGNMDRALDKIEQAIGTKSSVDGSEVDAAQYQANKNYKTYSKSQPDYSRSNVLVQLREQARHLFGYAPAGDMPGFTCTGGAEAHALLTRLDDLIENKHLSFRDNQWPRPQEAMGAKVHQVVSGVSETVANNLENPWVGVPAGAAAGAVAGLGAVASFYDFTGVPLLAAGAGAGLVAGALSGTSAGLTDKLALHGFCTIQLRKMAHDLALGMDVAKEIDALEDQGTAAEDAVGALPIGTERDKRLAQLQTAMEESQGMVLEALGSLNAVEGGGMVNTEFEKYASPEEYKLDMDPKAVRRQIRSAIDQLDGIPYNEANNAALNTAKANHPHWQELANAHRFNATDVIERLENNLGLEGIPEAIMSLAEKDVVFKNAFRNRGFTNLRETLANIKATANDTFVENYWGKGLVPDIPKNPVSDKHTAAPERVWSENNVLFKLYKRRMVTLHGVDPAQVHMPGAGDGADGMELGGHPLTVHEPSEEGRLTARLEFLLRQNIYLPTGEREVVAPEHSEMPGTFPTDDKPKGGSVYDNPFAIVTGKAIQDQLALEQALSSISLVDVDGDAGRRAVEDATQKIFRANDTLSKHFDRGGFDLRSTQLLANLQYRTMLDMHPDSLVTTAVTHGGRIDMRDLEAIKRKEWGAMPTGTVYYVESSTRLGGDGDGAGHSIRPTSRQEQGKPEHYIPNQDKNKMNIPLNSFPSWMPVWNISGARAHSTSVVKTAGGGAAITMKVDKDFAASYEKKLMWGLGRYANHKVQVPGVDGKPTTSGDALVLDYFGLEVIPGVFFNRSASDEITFQIAPGEKGLATQIATQLMALKLTPRDIFDSAENEAYSRTVSKNFGIGMNGQPLQATVSIFNSPTDVNRRFKAVLGGLTQFQAKMNWLWSNTESHGGKQISKSEVKKARSTQLNAVDIQVTEIQSSLQHPGPSWFPRKFFESGRAQAPFLPGGENGHPIINDYFEHENKVPLAIGVTPVNIKSGGAYIPNVQVPNFVRNIIGDNASNTIERGTNATLNTLFGNFAPSIQRNAQNQVTGASIRMAVDSKDFNIKNFPQLAAIKMESPSVYKALMQHAKIAQREGRPINVDSEALPGAVNVANRLGSEDALKDFRNFRIKSISSTRDRERVAGTLTGFSAIRAMIQAKSGTNESGYRAIELQYSPDPTVTKPISFKIRTAEKPDFAALDQRVSGWLEDKLLGVGGTQDTPAARNRKVILATVSPEATTAANVAEALRNIENVGALTATAIPRLDMRIGGVASTTVTPPHLAVVNGQVAYREYDAGTRTWRATPLTNAQLNSVVQHQVRQLAVGDADGRDEAAPQVSLTQLEGELEDLQDRIASLRVSQGHSQGSGIGEQIGNLTRREGQLQAQVAEARRRQAAAAEAEPPAEAGQADPLAGVRERVQPAAAWTESLLRVMSACRSEIVPLNVSNVEEIFSNDDLRFLKDPANASLPAGGTNRIAGPRVYGRPVDLPGILDAIATAPRNIVPGGPMTTDATPAAIPVSSYALDPQQDFVLSTFMPDRHAQGATLHPVTLSEHDRAAFKRSIDLVAGRAQPALKEQDDISRLAEASAQRVGAAEARTNAQMAMGGMPSGAG